MLSKIKNAFRHIRAVWLSPLLQTQQDILTNLKSRREMQIFLSLKYKELASGNAMMPTFDEVEFRCFSQNGEDGILLYIFSLIGSINKTAVEICAGNGIECNTANLIINHGWTGLLFDGNASLIESGRNFYARCADTLVWPPTLVNAWINKDNVNRLIVDNGVQGEIDLLSLDMDGIDYWVWKAIDSIQPRVVVVECQNIWGADKAVTVPYREDFIAEWSQQSPDYGGASLAAFVKLGREKGYRLVGSQRYGFNAFFIRSGIAEGLLPEVEPVACLNHPQAQHAIKNRLSRVIDKHWVEV